MEDRGTGLEGMAGDVDRGHAAAYEAVSLEDSDVEIGNGIGRVSTEEVGNGRAADAGADYADGGGVWGLWFWFWWE